MGPRVLIQPWKEKMVLIDLAVPWAAALVVTSMQAKGIEQSFSGVG